MSPLLVNNHGISFNKRRAGAPKLPWSARGGGRLDALPSDSAPRRRSEETEKKHSKARQKSFRNYFCHFFAQVNIEVTRGHIRSNDTNGCLVITFELRKLAK